MSQLDPRPPLYYPAPPANLKPISPWVWIASIVAVLAVCAAAISIYKSIKQQTRDADGRIASLHAKMIQGDDAGIFAESDPYYQEQVGELKSKALFARIRQQLGTPRSSTYLSQQTNYDPKLGAILTLKFTTVFDKGTGTETLGLHKSDSGVYRMTGYWVRSKQLTRDPITTPILVKP